MGQESTFKQLRSEIRSLPFPQKIQRLEKFVSEADPNKDDRVRAVDQLCRELASVGRCEDADQWLAKGKKWAKAIDAKFVLMKLYQVEAAIACDLAEYERGVSAATVSIEMAEGSPWKSFAALPLIERGICHTCLNHYVAAIEDFGKSLEIADSRNKDQWKLRALSNLAPTYGAMGQLEKEFETINAALAIAKKYEVVDAEAALTANLGNNFLTSKKLEEAETAFASAYEIAMEHDLPRFVAIAATGIGDVSIAKREFGVAQARFEEAGTIYQKINDPVGTVQLQARMAAVDKELELVSAATEIDELNRLLVEARRIGDQELVISLLEQLITAHKGEHNWEKTLELLDERQAIERRIWATVNEQAAERLISNRKALNQQKQASSFLAVICVVSLVMTSGALVLWLAKRRMAEMLRKDRETILQNEKIKLSKQRELARRDKSESIAMMSAGIIHDFNNFLSAIVSSAELGQLLDSSEKKDELFESILNTGMSASELTRNLSDFIGLGKVTDSQCEIHSVIEREKEFLAQLVGHKVDVCVTTDHVPVWVNFDAVEIKQILSNLIKNAGEAFVGREGKVEIETYLDLEKRLCTLVVRDNGSGMDQEMIDRATDPFFSSKGVGRGLGLASVKGVVERNGGAVFIKSKVDEGSEISIEMPIVESVPVSNSNIRKAEESQELVFEKILFVEDDEAIQSRVKVFLERLGCCVVATDSVEKAIEIVENDFGFDCIVTDFLLNDQSGRFLAKNLKALLPQTPILLVSGYAENDVFESDLFDDFVPKPFKLNQLLDALNRLASIPFESETNRKTNSR